MYGICNLSIVPLRVEPSNISEMISQVVFGEHFEVLGNDKNWSKIKLAFDNTVGYIDNMQYQIISEKVYTDIENSNLYLSKELIDFITDDEDNLTTVPLGAHLPLYSENSFSLNEKKYIFEGDVISKKLDKPFIVDTAFLFLNSPYLWGGKTPFGIDCSGFTQTVYKLCGYKLPRSVEDQSKQGEVLSFIEESESGDLAFFDDENGNIVHVGIVMNDYNIIHAHGKVRIDKLDHSGIYNVDSGKHTHKLRVIKRLIS